MVLDLVFKAVLFILLSFTSGYILGILSRKILQLLMAITFVIFGLASLELMNIIDTGLGFPSLIIGFFETIGLVKFLTSIGKISESFLKGETEEAIFAFQIKNMVIFILIIAITAPFIIGFFKAFARA